MNCTGRATLLDSFFCPRRFALGLGFLLAACFAPVLFGFQSFVFRDFGLFGHPLAYYHHESFWRGEIPFWNPLNNCGLPFMAQWNTMVFYPGSLIYLLLPLPWSLNVFCLVHLWLGGLGMYFLARRWTESNFAAAFAGIVFALNGLSLHCLMWPNNIAALGWMPWILLLVERACAGERRILVPAILAGACQFMIGAPEAFLLTWIGTAVLWLAAMDANRAHFAKYLARFVAIVAGVVALSAVQLLPLLELIRESQRTSGYDTGGWAMPAWGWANLLVPMFRTVSNGTGQAYQLGQAWTSSYYFGVGTLWLALIALVGVRGKRAWALGLIVLLGLVLALGDSGFIWPMLKHYVGALGFIRYPVKLVFLVAVPLTLLGALGVASLVRSGNAGSGTEAANQVHSRIPAGMGAALLGLIALILWLAWRHPVASPNAFNPLPNGLVRALFFLGLMAGIFFLRKAGANRAVLAASLSLALVAADFLTHLPWQNPTVPASMLAPKLEALQSLRESAGPGRFRIMSSLQALQRFHETTETNLGEGYLSHRLGQSHNLNLLDGIAKTDGFFSLYLNRQQDVQYRIFPDADSVHPAIAEVMAIGFMTAPGQLFEWSARSNALPVISVGQQPLFVSDENSLNTILYSNFNPHTSVILPPEAQSSIAAMHQPEAEVRVEKFAAQEIELKVTTPGATVVSVSQSYYPAWKAYVDNKPATLWRANHAFQAVSVPAGEHRISLRYEDKKFRLGATVSILSLALLLVAGWVGRSR